MSKKWFFVSLALTLLLSACGISLASDITPPPTYKSPTPPKVQAQTNQSAAQPLLPPDPVQGAAYYVEKCLPCHGATGRGDGPQAAKLGLPVPAIGSLELARNARPADWYDLITNGRMEKGMPPFKSLNDRQRWDVLAYSLTLSAPQASVQQGKALYEQKCVACHGPAGRGDGTSAASSGAKMPDWTDQGRLVKRSASDLVNVINNGVAPGMPAFASQLSEDQRWALADYIRSLSFAGNGTNPSAAAVTPAANATPAAGVVTPAANATPVASASTSPFKAVVTGKVSTSGGASLPAGLKVTLQGYDNMAPSWSATSEVKADGTYRFEEVEVLTGRTFLATVDYQNIPYDSDPLHAADMRAGQEANLPITLAEVTSDAAALSVQRMHVFFDFSQAGSIQVAELFIVTNAGDKAVAPASNDQPVLRFELPAGATELSFQDGEMGVRYTKTEKGFGDLSPVLPKGQVQVLFGYLLPYNGKTSVSIPLNLPVESTVVMVPSGGISVESAQLRSAGSRNVDGIDIQMFSASSLPAGSKLDLTISGQPSANLPEGTIASAASSQNELVIGIGAFGVVLIIAGLWLYRQRRTSPRDEFAEEVDPEAPVEMDVAEDTPEALLDAIVALDDLYQSGQLPEAAYQQRRAELKACLKSAREK